ncbi:hypothetical protein AB6I73_000049 [Citrobacter amalonaticus]|uniref:hypothetical protein n=1 Tax=Citrobacter TaxID=544 RepID=UPI001C7CDF90|nr:hypothetical protein [Citrobacter amalonaticus]QZA38294.1 hypothetical protein K1713_10030 [Citrobacter amalonaticus]
MSIQLEGLANAINAAREKSLRIYLLTSNPSNQQDFDDLTFNNLLWVNPRIVAADGTQLAYYSSISSTWVTTKARKMWINLLAVPPSYYLEIRGQTLSFYLMAG